MSEAQLLDLEAEVSALRKGLEHAYDLLITATNTLSAHVAVTQAFYEVLTSEGMMPRDRAMARAVAYAQAAGLSPAAVDAMHGILAPLNGDAGPTERLH